MLTRFGAATRLATSFLFVAALPVVLGAHAVVHPARSAPGAYERYVLRVPNEREVPTTRVEIQFPAETRVTSFSDVPGWTLEVIDGAAGSISGAVWTGVLPAQRFVEFPFVAVNPATEGSLVWPVMQTYEGGEVVEWAGPEDSSTPASVTILAVAALGPGQSTFYLAAAAVVLAFIALGFAIRRPAVD